MPNIKKNVSLLRSLFLVSLTLRSHSHRPKVEVKAKFFTTRIRRREKVLFPQASLCPHRGGGVTPARVGAPRTVYLSRSFFSLMFFISSFIFHSSRKCRYLDSFSSNIVSVFICTECEQGFTSEASFSQIVHTGRQNYHLTANRTGFSKEWIIPNCALSMDLLCQNVNTKIKKGKIFKVKMYRQLSQKSRVNIQCVKIYNVKMCKQVISDKRKLRKDNPLWKTTVTKFTHRVVSSIIRQIF